jgi:pyruvate dehydrogenase E2 component (dihydrolipoamide acetyltransferase)
MERALQWLEAENENRSIKERLLPVVLLIKAVARALEEVPALNGYWRQDRHVPQEAIHVGFAISLRQGGLVAPAIHDADRKRLDEIMATLDDLITRARSGRLRSSELTDPTITVTSLGDLGVETVHGVIYPPQVALVGFGTIHERPWAEGGLLGVRRAVTATLAADHRATDGRQGGKLLDAIRRSLQHPDAL